MSQTKAVEAKIHAVSPVVNHKLRSVVAVELVQFSSEEILLESPPSGAVPLYSRAGKDILFFFTQRLQTVTLFQNRN